jgi:hypothetical protein
MRTCDDILYSRKQSQARIPLRRAWARSHADRVPKVATGWRCKIAGTDEQPGAAATLRRIGAPTWSSVRGRPTPQRRRRYAIELSEGLLHYALSGVAPPAATSSALNGYLGPNHAPHKCAGEWTSLRRLLATRKASAGASRTALHGSGTSAWLDADRKCPESEIICTLLGSFGKEKVAVFPRSALACTPPQGASADRRVYRP